MSMEKLAAIWPEWKIVEQLGEGSFGKVYKVVRQELSVTTYAAVKVISVPHSESEIASLKSEGMDDNAARAYLQGVVNDFINEIKLMESLKGTTNIVSVEDFKVVEHKDNIGWDIFIRMELLTPFNEYIGDRKMSEEEVVRLGVDMCTALELCARRKIIHRDIKPENIFVSAFGDFKIGDFGIARELEKTSGALSSKGTYNYIAPEVVMGRGYDASVDIYSLGLVLYKLMNNNRLPFIDPYAPQIMYQQRKEAVDRRIGGDELPPPVNASEALASVILAACSYKPENRFGTPTAMKKALLSLDTISKTALIKRQAQSGTVTVVNTPAVKAEVPTKAKQKKTAEKKKKGGKLRLIIILTAVIAVLGVAAFTAYTYYYPATKAVECIERGDYEGAEKYLVKVSADNSILLKGIKGRLDAIEKGFTDKSISYEDAKKELESIASLNIQELSDRIVQIKEKINSLNDERLIEAIVTAVSQGDYETAIALYEGIQNDDGVLGGELKGYLDKIYEDSEKGVLSVGDAYAALETIEGMNVQGLAEKIESIRNDLDTLSHSREVFETAKTFEERGNYAKAIEFYRLVSENDPDYDSAMGLLEGAVEKYRQQLFNEAESYGEAYEYVSAMEALDKGLILLPEDEAILKEREKYEAEFEKVKLSEAAELLENGEYDKAEAEIKYALEILPDSEALKALLESVDSYRPVQLDALTVVDSVGYSYKSGEFTDSFGNVHKDGAYVFDASYADAYAVYNLNGEYSLTDLYVTATPDTSSESSFTVRVFLDDELAGEITDFKKTSGKMLISIDAEGAEKLEIRVYNCETNYSRIAVVDTQLEKSKGE